MAIGKYEGHIIANTILDEMFSAGREIRPMKLQKLLYYTVGFTLLKYEQSPIHEHFYKWTYGPVVPEVYTCFKTYGYLPINSMKADPDGKFYISSDENILRVIKNEVLPYYSRKTDIELSKLTHRHSAWKGVKKNHLIDNESILSTFRDLTYGE